MKTRIDEIMRTQIWSCRPDDMLSKAAGLMWDHDIGCLPVVDADNRPLGMITDRDICMSSYLSGRSLFQTAVEDAMSKRVVTVAKDRRIEEAEALLRENQLHRLAVVDDQGKLAGVISVTDLIRGLPAAVSGPGVLRTLGSITAPRSGRHAKKEQPAVY